MNETAAARVLQIDLCDVASYNHPAAMPHAGEEHFHLRVCRVLRLVKNDEAIIQAPTTHECQRRNFDHITLHKPLDLIEAQQVVQRVEQWHEVGIHFFKQRARQE